MGKTSQRKGRNGEYELANILRDMYGYDVKRGSVFLHQSDMVGLAGIHPEVKRVEHLNIHTAMEQAIREADIRHDGLPTVFHRKNRSEWLVTQRLTDWIDLYGAWTDGKEDTETEGH